MEDTKPDSYVGFFKNGTEALISAAMTDVWLGRCIGGIVRKASKTNIF